MGVGAVKTEVEEEGNQKKRCGVKKCPDKSELMDVSPERQRNNFCLQRSSKEKQK